MRIGNHVGKRAKHNDQDGYVFETIEHNGILFVYDDNKDMVKLTKKVLV